MENTLTVGLAGRYKFIAQRPDGTRRDLTDWFDNLITNAGLEQAGVGGFKAKCRVGSGNTTPTNGDTALVAQVAEADQTSSTEGYDSVGNLYCWQRIVYRFAAGAAAGNLSEVGVGWDGGALFSRALIKDSGGSPTTITVLPDEILDVVYELRLYRPTSDASVDIVISGVTYTCTVRAANFGSWRPTTFSHWGAAGYADIRLVQGWGADAALGAITDQPSGTQNLSAVYAATDGAYVSSSHERKFKVVVGVSACTTPLKAFTIYTTLGIYQMLVSPNIPKNSENQLTLNYKIAWARR